MVVAALVALFYIPRITIGDVTLRRVNIFSDIQRTDSCGRILAEVFADSAEGIVEETFNPEDVKVEVPVYHDSIPEGMTAIEDFGPNGPSMRRVMDRFYEALNHASSRPVRIAYYGDSYVEGDILTEELRNLLQGSYGGCGVGYVDIHCVSSGFRRTVKTSAKGWTEHHANDGKGKGFNAQLQGISGGYFIPSQASTAEFSGQSLVFANRLSRWDKTTVFYTPGSGMQLYGTQDDGEEQLLSGNGQAAYSSESTRVEEMTQEDDTLGETSTPAPAAIDPASGIQSYTLHGSTQKFKLRAAGNSASRVYGVALDGTNGISLDNFSMRSSDGTFIKDIPLATFQQFARLRSYDLIIVHYGLNTAGPKVKDYSHYTTRMAEAIRHLQQAYPEAAILIVSVPDRDQRGADGEMHTMGGVRELADFQRRMASDTNVAFWNLYQAMGGDGAVAKMVEKQQANKDFTHINFAGGKHIATLLFDVLKNGKENYDNR